MWRCVAVFLVMTSVLPGEDLRGIALRYSIAIREGGAGSVAAEKALDASGNVWIVGNAAHNLQNFYNETVQTGRPDSRLRSMAERYFLRAKKLDPRLERQVILPEIDMAAIARQREESKKRWIRLLEEGERNIRRLPIDAFPELPAAVADTLHRRGCTVPQYYGARKPVNVIRGEFFRRGERGWAVLCSVKQASAILAFRHDEDREPVTVTQAVADRHYLQSVGETTVGFSRGIGAADRDFIVAHYHAYGGPQPPPIDHHGIDDAFIEKASVTLYFHAGKWMELTGAD